MSIFEIILVAIIYMFGYGYTLANVLSDYKNRSKVDVLCAILFCIIHTLYFPILLGIDIYNKLDK